MQTRLIVISANCNRPLINHGSRIHTLINDMDDVADLIQD